MANEDMDGNYLGGGSIDHLVFDGDIYLNAEHIALLLLVTGSTMGATALALDDQASMAAAHMVLTIAEKIDELKSELLKREIEASWVPADFED